MASMIYVLSMVMARWGKLAYRVNSKRFQRILYAACRESSGMINFTLQATAASDQFRGTTKLIGNALHGGFKVALQSL
jgi:hypothetical protein